MNLYPETDLNQRNLGWIISELKKLDDMVKAIAATGTGNIEVIRNYTEATDTSKFYIYMGTPDVDDDGTFWNYKHGYSFNTLTSKWEDRGSVFVDYPITIQQGGTGATNAPWAISNLGITPSAIGAVDDDAIIDVSHGGTSADNAADARTNLGINLTNLGAEPAFSVLDVAKGGTGGSTQAEARTSLGLGTAAVVNVPISTANGGTGANNITNARKNLQALGTSDVTYFQTDYTKISGIAAGANQAVEIDVHRDGYTCIGIGSVFGTGTGYFSLYEYYFVRSNGRDKVNLGFYNRTSAAHDLTPKVRCIYVKDTWT